MTDQQQTDLGLWKQNQSQPLPASLKNILIEDCKIYILTKLRNIAEKEKTSYYPNPMPSIEIARQIEATLTSESFYLTVEAYPETITELGQWECETIQKGLWCSFLSRTPDGQAVMPFLNVKIENSNLTLDNLLYNSFVESLRVGGSFEKSYQIINKTYLLYFDLTK